MIAVEGSWLLVETARAALARVAEDSWTLSTGDFWCRADPPDRRPREQGWRLHVSATQLAAPLVLACSAGVLARWGCAFKFARGPGRAGYAAVQPVPAGQRREVHHRVPGRRRAVAQRRRGAAPGDGWPAGAGDPELPAVAAGERRGGSPWWSSRKTCSWPRSSYPARRCGPGHWCSGSSGVGTFLVRLWAATGEPRYLEVAEAAAVAVTRDAWYSGTAACDGLAGDGEFLLDLAAATGDRRRRDRAEELAAVFQLRLAVRNGRWLLSGDDGTAPDLVQHGYVRCPRLPATPAPRRAPLVDARHRAIRVRRNRRRTVSLKGVRMKTDIAALEPLPTRDQGSTPDPRRRGLCDTRPEESVKRSLYPACPTTHTGS